MGRKCQRSQLHLRAGYRKPSFTLVVLESIHTQSMKCAEIITILWILSEYKKTIFLQLFQYFLCIFCHILESCNKESEIIKKTQNEKLYQYACKQKNQ